MLGKYLYRTEKDFELNSERTKSLVFFYKPLISEDSLYLYLALLNLPFNGMFNELNDLLNKLNLSISELESRINPLNQYGLLKTLKNKNEEKYIFLLKKPLTRTEFMNDSLLSRELILKIGGQTYQSLASDVYVMKSDLSNYDDISMKRDVSVLDEWKSSHESYLNISGSNEFGTFFDVNKFFSDISVLMFPMKFRTKENLREIALLADLYSISYDQMRKYITDPTVCTYDSESVNLKKLAYLCQKATLTYVESDSVYNIPCALFLANIQDGKEATPYDKKIIYKLAHDYVLRPEVINVLLEASLKNCDGRLLEKYIFGVASDMHRQNINDAKSALEMLNGNQRKMKKDVLPEYDTSTNPEIDLSRLDDILDNRGK